MSPKVLGKFRESSPERAPPRPHLAVPLQGQPPYLHVICKFFNYKFRLLTHGHYESRIPSQANWNSRLNHVTVSNLWNVMEGCHTLSILRMPQKSTSRVKRMLNCTGISEASCKPIQPFSLPWSCYHANTKRNSSYIQCPRKPSEKVWLIAHFEPLIPHTYMLLGWMSSSSWSTLDTRCTCSTCSYCPTSLQSIANS